MDGPELEWACSRCPKKAVEEIHPYTYKLLNVRTLNDAGFPLDEDILNYEEWLDLGRINRKIAAYEQADMVSGVVARIFMGSGK